MSTSRAVLIAALCSASLTLAQSAPPPLPPPPADAPVATTSAPAPMPAVTPVEKPYQMGVRIGGSAGLGAWVPGPMISFHLFDLHGGLQVSPMFAAYLRVGYSASVGIGIMANAMGASVSASAAGMWLIGANAELGLGDSFFIAGGPQVGVGSWARTRVTGNTSGGSVQAIVSSGAHPGFDFKIGFGLGQPNKQTKRRTQATIALDLSMLYATKVTEAMASGGTTGASVGVNFSEAFAIVPTLHVGFEFR
ncbi:MAG: hypothetical protein Q8L14_01055 [Myxococcales bacterium]|nr:hypothetical protein [Myxococcales bacterium]